MHRAVADHIAARAALSEGGAPVFLFGHSLGGLVTAESVARSPGGVAGVVLSAPALLVEIGGALKAVAGLVSMMAPGARLTPPVAPESLSRVEEEVAAYPRTRRSAGFRLRRGWARRRSRYRRVAGAGMTPGGRRCWWCAGQRPAKGSERFFGMIRSADKRLEIYPEGYHELQNDLDRDAARTLILGWLEARLPR